MRHLIIGGSIAGIAAARAIRSRDSAADITLVTAESGRPYYRPLIPYLIENPDKDIGFSGDPYDAYASRTVRAAVEGVNARAREVVLAGGERLSYDRLLIAAGARPLVPDIDGLRGAGSFHLRSAEDALAIGGYAKDKKEAVIIGAGLVGIKAALALKTVGVTATLIEQKEQILIGRIDRRGAAIIQKALDEAGCRCLTLNTVKSIAREAGGVTGAVLESGEQIRAEMLVTAAGTEPDVSFLKDSGIGLNRGVVVNERLETTEEGIYAAGDVAEYTDAVSGKPSVSALWTNAEEMGRLAGTNMAGSALTYHGFLGTMIATEILGLPFVSVGMIDPAEAEGYEVFVDDQPGNYRKLVFRDNRLSGFVFLGDVNGAGIYTNLVRNRIALNGLRTDSVVDVLKYIRFLSMPDKQGVGTA